MSKKPRTRDYYARGCLAQSVGVRFVRAAAGSRLEGGGWWGGGECNKWRGGIASC